MAITKTVIKLTHQEAFVKVVNDSATPASVTIALATDLLRSDETLSGALDVRLSAVEYSVGAASSIIRNAINVLELPAEAGKFEHDTCNDPTQKGSDLAVTIGQGTVLIRLLKVSGYTPNFKPAQNGGY